MKKNRRVFFVLLFVLIFLIVITGWLYRQNPLEKIYNSLFIGFILGLTALISSISSFFFQKYDIKRIIFPLLVTLVLIIVYFII